MRHHGGRGVLFLAVICLGLAVISLSGTAAAAPSTPALAASPTATSYLTAIQSGTCDKLGDTVADLGTLETTQAGSGQGQLQGSVASPPVLSTDKTIDTSMDELTSSPNSITVRRQDTTGTELIACGPITAIANNGQIAIGLQPMTIQNVAGIVLLEKAESGNGTHLTIYLLSVVAQGGGAGATPTK